MACWILITGLFRHCPAIQPASQPGGRQPSCVMMMVSLLSVEPQSVMVVMMMMVVSHRFFDKDQAMCVYCYDEGCLSAPRSV